VGEGPRLGLGRVRRRPSYRLIVLTDRSEIVRRTSVDRLVFLVQALLSAWPWVHRGVFRLPTLLVPSLFRPRPPSTFHLRLPCLLPTAEMPGSSSNKVAGVDAQDPPPQDGTAASEPPVFERPTSTPLAKDVLTCVRTASRAPRRRADPSQCLGHLSYDINAPACPHRDGLEFCGHHRCLGLYVCLDKKHEPACGHRRCNNCAVTCTARCCVGAYGFQSTVTCRVGNYPGAAAVQAKLEEECEPFRLEYERQRELRG